MKKFLVVAALVAASMTPAMPVGAAEKLTDREASPALCFFLPLLPQCIEYWKEKGDEAKGKVEEMMAK
jgi:hypothetical protein